MSGRRLFEPITLGALSLRNRIVMAPMTRRFSPGGVPTEAVARYYQRRAEGGVGLIMSEGLEIADPASGYDAAVPNFFAAEALAAWRVVVDQVQAAGSTFVPQLWHVGGYRATFADAPRPEAPGVAPSGVYRPGETFGPPMTEAEIDRAIDAYARAAETAFLMGCDGVAIHGAHGYLIDQFFWPTTNLRDDRYGGCAADRSRFAIEVIRACRRRTSPDFPIFFRFSQWKLQEYAARLFASPDELGAFLEPLAEAGVDVFDCSTRRFWTPEFEGSDLNLAGWTRRLSGKPSMTVGSVGLDNDVVASMKGDGTDVAGVAGLERLEEMLERGDFDLVGVGRALLADADWVDKIRGGRRDELKDFVPGDLLTLN